MLLDESQPEESRKGSRGKSRALRRSEIVFAQVVDLAAELAGMTANLTWL
jgi:hypothetical protein